MVNIHSYGHYIVGFSGGKDCTAAFLWLLQMGIPKEKIELWHHMVDGPEKVLFDWPVTTSYCMAFGKAFGVSVYRSWLEGGFEREMLREDQAKARTWFESPSGTDGLMYAGGKSSRTGTRLMFPQLSGSLSVRWCSAYLKIDVERIAINNDPRFAGKRILIITGERAQESTGRAKYLPYEHTDHYKEDRTVHRFRPVLYWSEQQVWNIIKEHKVIVHPCYYLGFPRCSCAFCIFGNNDQMMSAYYLLRGQGEALIAFEKRFEKTMKRNIELAVFMSNGNIYKAIYKLPQFVAQIRNKVYYMPIFTSHWVLPAGAYSKGEGPT